MEALVEIRGFSGAGFGGVRFQLATWSRGSLSTLFGLVPGGLLAVLSRSFRVDYTGEMKLLSQDDALTSEPHFFWYSI